MGNKLKLFTLAALLLAVSACEGQPKRAEESVSKSTRHAARQAGASFVTEVQFSKGMAELTDASKKNLDELLTKARKAGEIDEVVVLAWADQAYPQKGEKTLSSDQVRVADHRRHAIKDYLKTVDRGLDVDTHNMAKRPNALQKLFETSDAKVKRAMEAAGLGTKGTAKGELDKSKAIVMVVLDEED